MKKQFYHYKIISQSFNYYNKIVFYIELLKYFNNIIFSKKKIKINNNNNLFFRSLNNLNNFNSIYLYDYFSLWSSSFNKFKNISNKWDIVYKKDLFNVLNLKVETKPLIYDFYFKANWNNKNNKLKIFNYSWELNNFIYYSILNKKLLFNININKSNLNYLIEFYKKN